MPRTRRLTFGLYGTIQFFSYRGNIALVAIGLMVWTGTSSILDGNLYVNHLTWDGGHIVKQRWCRNGGYLHLINQYVVSANPISC